MTINSGLAMKKLLAGRVAELQMLRARHTSRSSTTYGIGENTRVEVVEPSYSITSIDTKVVELELAIYKLDAAIKATNATTELDIVVDERKLMSPIEPA